MSRMIEAQTLSIEVLRFILSLRGKRGFSDLFKEGWYDSMLFEFAHDTLSISVLAGDTELGQNTYVSTMYNSIEKLELVDSDAFEGLELGFGGDGIAVVFNAAREFGKDSVVFGARLIRVSDTHGSFEVSIKSFGTVFINYKLTMQSTGRIGIHISNISASWNPMIAPAPTLRAS